MRYRSTLPMRNPPSLRPSGADREETILALPDPRTAIPSVTAFRSTWVVSSLESLRLGGYWDRYLEKLVDHRDEVLSCVAGVWLPIDVARAHYRACDALGLSSEDMSALGRGPGGQVRRAWHATLIAAAGKPEISPWDVLPQIESGVATNGRRRRGGPVPSRAETSPNRVRGLPPVRDARISGKRCESCSSPSPTTSPAGPSFASRGARRTMTAITIFSGPEHGVACGARSSVVLNTASHAARGLQWS